MCGAVVLGSLIGAHAPPAQALAGAFVAGLASVGLLTVARPARRTGPPAPLPRPSTGLPPALAPALLPALLALAVLRGVGEPVPDPSGARSLAAAGCFQPGWAAPLPAIGPWLPGPGPTLGEVVRGRLPPLGPLAQMPAGAVEAGERIGLLSDARPVFLAQAEAGTPPIARLEFFGDEVVRLRGARGLAPRGPGSALAELRRRGLARLGGIGDAPTRALFGALLFGDRSELEPDRTDLFTRTGTRHLLALSGLHVGLVACLLAWPLGSALARLLEMSLAALGLARARVPPGILRAALILLLIPVGGAGAPVSRAAVAAALVALAPTLPGSGPRGTGRRIDAPSLWALALSLECLQRPGAVAEVGLQLSYAATAGLVLCTGGALASLRLALPAGGRLAPTWASGRGRSPWWRVPTQKLLDAALAGIAASLVAVLATLPIAWTRFGEWSPVGILATPLVLPALAALLAVGWCFVLAPGSIPAALPAALAEGLSSVLHAFDALPGTPVQLPPRPLLLVGLGPLAWLRALAAPGTARPAAGRLGAAALGLACLPWACAPRGLELRALDVGHGTAVILRAPGEACWLFDAGSRDRLGVARAAIAPLLRRWEVARTRIVASHGDRDHVGALPWIQERWPAELWVGALGAHTRERLPHDVPRLDLSAGRLELPTGGRLPGTARGALRLSLLRGLQAPGNEGSRSLLVGYGGRSMLLCGDAEAEGLERLLSANRFGGRLDLLLLPHHGSETPLFGALMAATRPRRVWVSCSGAPPLANELDRRGSVWEATGVAGALELAWPRDRAGDVRVR